MFAFGLHLPDLPPWLLPVAAVLVPSPLKMLSKGALTTMQNSAEFQTLVADAKIVAHELYKVCPGDTEEAKVATVLNLLAPKFNEGLQALGVPALLMGVADTLLRFLVDAAAKQAEAA